MILFKTAKDLHNYIENESIKSSDIGFVPTMGALHSGHLSLIEKCKSENKLTVCSIFVNPTQFNDPSDFEKYPSTIDADIDLLVKKNCDILFLPSVAEMYPEGETPKQYDLGPLEHLLEGSFRPGHFQGVCMIVEKLLRIVQPHNLYMGQKDYQQCMVIHKLLEIMNAQEQIQLNICPTQRANNGLALSSRNMRLNETEKEEALILYSTLNEIKENLHTKSLSVLQEEATRKLEAAGLKVDYVSIANAETLEPITNWNGQAPLVALIAAYLKDVRLIDNMLLQ